MIKRVTAVLISAIMIFMMAMPIVYAETKGEPEGLVLESTSPKNEKKISAQNVMIKLNFNNSIYAKETQRANKAKFKFTDSKGNKIGYKVYYDDSNHNKISILAVKDLKIDETYTFTVDGSLSDDKGNKLGADEIIKFKTKGNGGGKVYGLLMIAMIVVMVVVTVRDAKKAKESDDFDINKEKIQRNPYKLAKEKGISVEEAKQLIAKDIEKAEKKAEKSRQRKQAEYEAKLAEEEARKNIYRVPGKRVVKRKK